MLPLHVDWTDISGSLTYRGGTDAWISQELIHGILFPTDLGVTKSVVLKNTAQERKMSAAIEGIYSSCAPETLVNVKLYLTCSDPVALNVLTVLWPAENAGVEVSFDGGLTWRRFNRSTGYEGDPATWILLPGSSVSTGYADGKLGPYPPYNQATLLFRIQAPKNDTNYGLYSFGLGIDCDVL